MIKYNFDDLRLIKSAVNEDKEECFLFKHKEGFYVVGVDDGDGNITITERIPQGFIKIHEAGLPWKRYDPEDESTWPSEEIGYEVIIDVEGFHDRMVLGFDRSFGFLDAKYKVIYYAELREGPKVDTTPE